MYILLHSSKTMRKIEENNHATPYQAPLLIEKAEELAKSLKRLSVNSIQEGMSLSLPLAIKTRELLQNFQLGSPVARGLPAIDNFLGDIYSGLQVQTFTKEDRAYANEHLFILSGLYGVLRALDTIQPYRLEMGYKLPGINLYTFWGEDITRQLPLHQPVINLSAKEYTKAIFPSFRHIEGLKDVPIISPKFLTVHPKTHQPTFVTVHAKIARGSFAGWLIRERISELEKIKTYNELGYEYDEALSSELEPVFVAKEFKGLGLSVRLS